MTASTPVDFITREEARYLALVAQRLEPLPGAPPPVKPTKAHLLHLIRQAGCIQLDSISVVSRAHETAVWSRAGAFRPADLNALHDPNRQLIEYWAHAASLLPVEFLPYLRRSMESFHHPATTSWGKWACENRPLLDDVLRTIEQQGPLSTRAFERPSHIERQPWDWWGGKPAKQALDYLWTAGELVILRRVGFERVYELTDRAFPGLRAQPLPDPAGEAAFFVGRALRAVGVGTVSWIGDFYRLGSRRYVTPAETLAQLAALERTGHAHRVALEAERAPLWLDAGLVPALDAFRQGDARPAARTLLCPFDNLLWRRDRALALFGFDYRLESYTPEPKRIYGYYTLPILIDGRLIGRLDARYRRKERVFAVHAIHLEPGVKPTVAVAGQIARAIRAFVQFLGGGAVEVHRSAPEALAGRLMARLS